MVDPECDTDVARAAALTTVAVVYVVVVLGSSILFYTNGRHATALCQRSLLLTSLGGLFNAYAGSSLLIHAAFPFLPCEIPLLACYFGLIPFFMTFVARAVRLIIIYRLNQTKQTAAVDGSSSSRRRRSYLNKVLRPYRQEDIEKRILYCLVLVILVNIAYIIVLQFIHDDQPQGFLPGYVK
ncbi:hypothetical protein BC938DRAFT_482751 [Jimgerdemannia flammicorona]|uniref:Uncharacterized protein n=1 Tax=Jimgerdemannia flammicorona TaxID=994334 RepID=A0A433QDB3_9FUNG|nr:hypothetical protein BC938DRAFT_482751 [Jimgerdemannia flammicorona]